MSKEMFLKRMKQRALIGLAGLIIILYPGIGLTGVTDDLVVDNDVTLNISSDINYYTETIGDIGQGTITHTSGKNVVGDSITLGKQATGVGTYNLSGTGTIEGFIKGSQADDSWIVGDAGQGTFNQTGGDGSTTTLTLGNQASGNGTINFSEGDLTVTRSIYFGVETVGNYGTGTFIQTGGNHYADNLYIGENSGSIGTLTQSSGTTATKYLYLGDQSGSRGSYELSGNGSLTVYIDEHIGRSGTGTFTQSGGRHEVMGDNGLSLGSSSGGVGMYTLSGTGALGVNGPIVINNSSTFTQTGGNVGTNFFIGVSGTYNLEGGTLYAGNGIGISGTFNVTGTTTKIDTSVGNGGIVKTTNASVTWGYDYMNGGFTNSGTYISDHSMQTFIELTVNPAGHIVAASQDMFTISLDLENHSTQGNKWNTNQAVLKFITGYDPNTGTYTYTTHNLYLPGADLGPKTAGYNDNFAWGSLVIDEGQTIRLIDGNDTNSGTALYVNQILGVDCNLETLMVMNIIGDGGLNMYYNPFAEGNDYLEGKTFILSGDGTSRLIPTPVPASVLLLGSAILGLSFLGWRRRKN